MHQAGRIAQELNCGSYSTSLWEYMFTRTDDDAGPSSYSESEGDEAEEIDGSARITLKNIPSFQLTQDEDEEESFGLAAEELEFNRYWKTAFLKVASTSHSWSDWKVA
ncbi:hypothetical protein CRENBAI_011362 [Crenichthys baileyi]|uniref:Uncharacterized protein n=1 Tax=Crenichthys baileyi TaxID=28760 RepID=A0AAV9RDK6_9TELE